LLAHDRTSEQPSFATHPLDTYPSWSGLFDQAEHSAYLDQIVVAQRHEVAPQRPSCGRRTLNEASFSRAGSAFPLVSTLVVEFSGGCAV